MSHPNFSRRRINPFLHALCEMAAEQSAVGWRAFDTQPVKRDLSFYIVGKMKINF
jgi:hypothetical protein